MRSRSFQNTRTGTLSITDSILQRNKSLGFETKGYPGIFVLAKEVKVTGSPAREGVLTMVPLAAPWKRRRKP